MKFVVWKNFYSIRRYMNMKRCKQEDNVLLCKHAWKSGPHIVSP